MPAQAGIQFEPQLSGQDGRESGLWIPAFAGMTAAAGKLPEGAHP
jgi:hypothetical protein